MVLLLQTYFELLMFGVIILKKQVVQKMWVFMSHLYVVTLHVYITAPSMSQQLVSCKHAALVEVASLILRCTTGDAGDCC